ncbi:hypothetical protein C8Q74DRAFT_976957 [Fomes fomentarius]|nr:hypothetical protein C8Q74DRAFT_976957 [Fomes fomentarius]
MLHPHPGIPGLFQFPPSLESDLPSFDDRSPAHPPPYAPSPPAFANSSAVRHDQMDSERQGAVRFGECRTGAFAGSDHYHSPPFLPPTPRALDALSSSPYPHSHSHSQSQSHSPASSLSSSYAHSQPSEYVHSPTLWNPTIHHHHSHSQSPQHSSRIHTPHHSNSSPHAPSPALTNPNATADAHNAHISGPTSVTVKREELDHPLPDDDAQMWMSNDSLSASSPYQLDHALEFGSQYVEEPMSMDVGASDDNDHDHDYEYDHQMECKQESMDDGQEHLYSIQYSDQMPAHNWDNAAGVSPHLLCRIHSSLHAHYPPILFSHSFIHTFIHSLIRPRIPCYLPSLLAHRAIDAVLPAAAARPLHRRQRSRTSVLAHRHRRRVPAPILPRHVRRLAHLAPRPRAADDARVHRHLAPFAAPPDGPDPELYARGCDYARLTEAACRYD